MSLGLVVFVGAVVVGGTGAFFNDTESSTGNVFTAGAIDLRIDSEQHYNGNICVDVNDDPEIEDYQWVGKSEYPEPGTSCDGSWELADLVPGVHHFFNFADVKPGDEGENTISIHLDTNPAWMCVDIATVSNDDVDCTEPEIDDDANCDPLVDLPDADEFDGDLAQELNFFAWLDDGSIDGFQGQDEDQEEGDNIWQEGEIPLFSNDIGPISDTIGGVTYALADSSTGNGPIPAGSTQYIGLTWCAGDLTIVGPGDLDCDGSFMDNAAQTDEVIADLTFRVEQARNNPDFLCGEDEGLCNEENDVVFVLDSSLSIDSGELATMANAAKSFATALAPSTPGNHIGVVDFDSSATLRSDLTDINNAIDAMTSGGSTNLADGITTASTELAGGNDRPDGSVPDHMLIMTDGVPDSQAAATAAADAAKAAGTTIYVVGIGNGVDDAYLMSIASSPAHYFSAAEFADLETVLAGLADCPNR